MYRLRSFNKYGNTKVVIDGITFDSKREAIRYNELKLLEKAGEILDLKLQPEFVLQEKFTDFKGIKHRAIAYRADFAYWDTKHSMRIIEDCKGMRTELYKLKKKLFLYKYPLFFIKEV